MSTFNVCAFKPGRQQGKYLLRRVGVPFGIGVGLGSVLGFAMATMWVRLLGMLIVVSTALVVTLLWCYATFSVPENCFAVRARGDRIYEEVLGEGLHSGVVADEFHIIAKNPIRIDITGVSPTKDGGRVATVALQLTVEPSARFANAKNKNVFGAWVIEGKGDTATALHHVESAWKSEFKSLVEAIIISLNWEDLDQYRGSIGLFIESEGSQKDPLHRNRNFAVWFVTQYPGKNLVVPPAVHTNGDLLKWYDEYHVEIRAYLDECNARFEKLEEQEKLTASELHEMEKFVSRHEIHSGSVFTNCVATVAYDEASIKALQEKLLAEKKRDAAKVKTDSAATAADDLKAKGGNPNLAYAASMAAQGVPVQANVNVITGDAPDALKAAAAAGQQVGQSIKGNTP